MPDTGKTEPAAVWKEQNGVTSVRLHLEGLWFSICRFPPEFFRSRSCRGGHL